LNTSLPETDSAGGVNTGTARIRLDTAALAKSQLFVAQHQQRLSAFSREVENALNLLSRNLEVFFKFPKIAETGTRVPRNTHAPLTLPGILSTSGHCDRSRLCAMICAPFSDYRDHAL
jgi:hypothetical protein